MAELRGLCENWKQPIFFQFDTDMAKELLLRIITAVSAAGLHVSAIVSDLAGENRGLWNELDIHLDRTSFTSPVKPDAQIFVFSDVPHNMKNLRNHLIDDGVILEDNTLIDIETLHTMRNQNGIHLNLCPKLTLKLLEVVKAERMRVAPAVQLLSHRMSCLASKVFPDSPSISKFFGIINDGFDVMNSRIPINEKQKIKSGFGNDLDNQLKSLDELQKLLLTMRFRTKKKKKRKKALLPCQTGFVISIKSLLGLFHYLKNQYELKYILTSRLNQDALENLFSVIRSFSGLYINPTPPEFRYRLRLVLLGSRIRPPKGTNCTYEDSNISYLSRDLLTKNGISISQDTEDMDIEATENDPPMDCDPTTATTPEIDPATEDSLRYLAGYIAWKLKRAGNVKEYGTPNGKTPYVMDPNTNWIETLSKGGLLIPTKELWNWIQQCEKIFLEYFAGFQQQDRITSRLIALIRAREKDIDEEVVTQYVVTRLKI